MPLNITLLAHTVLADMPLSVEGTEFATRQEVDLGFGDVTDADALIEFAGRSCYQSWHLPNPNTYENAGYVRNIIGQGHFSVFEHASVSLYVEGVSRALTHELIRHRHLSFSELSQRFVNVENARFVAPPALIEAMEVVDPEHAEGLRSLSVEDAVPDAVESYRDVYAGLAAQGYTRKASREAARASMPNGTETKIVVTGNLRAWRDVLYKRWHVAADAEIREFAGEALKVLSLLAPAAFSDFPAVPFGTEEI